jgi:hypothetical protein
MGADIKEDPTFFDRADSFIELANEHCSAVGRGKVSAALMYGSARFQAWNAACWSDDVEDMKQKREETVEYFVEQYRRMLEDHLDDYIKNYAKYLRADGEA